MMEYQNFINTNRRGKFGSIVTVGIDLSKNVFAVHGVGESAKAVLSNHVYLATRAH
ncbi:hypothetical protein BLA23254_07819 [Burkholderia lata]|uniref:Transposase n=1 Tax=Burkholderia lata (strain ATCC 17760 / DSM 23089 / LMG 22485 / NCIMB 9086 / R18194 / 383) TaxID=482957 RepID=A0A6P2T0E6_BURL3|nr:hypothetical protein BLA23254_07819 [Burkholderia lata]